MWKICHSGHDNCLIRCYGHILVGYQKSSEAQSPPHQTIQYVYLWCDWTAVCDFFFSFSSDVYNTYFHAISYANITSLQTQMWHQIHPKRPSLKKGKKNVWGDGLKKVRGRRWGGVRLTKVVGGERDTQTEVLRAKWERVERGGRQMEELVYSVELCSHFSNY